jgi:ribosome maturation factor RimP
MVVVAQDIEARVRALASEAISSAGMQMVDVEYRREAGGWILRLYIDKPGGVTLDDCQRVSHEIGAILEVEDPIPQHFTLEVSSPGLNRPLRTEADYAAAVGRMVRLTSRQPLAGQRHFKGRVLAAGPRNGSGAAAVSLKQEDGKDVELSFADIEKGHIVHEWPDTSARKAGRPVHPDSATKRGAR